MGMMGVRTGLGAVPGEATVPVPAPPVTPPAVLMGKQAAAERWAEPCCAVPCCAGSGGAGPCSPGRRQPQPSAAAAGGCGGSRQSGWRGAGKGVPGRGLGVALPPGSPPRGPPLHHRLASHHISSSPFAPHRVPHPHPIPRRSSRGIPTPRLPTQSSRAPHPRPRLSVLPPFHQSHRGHPHPALPSRVIPLHLTGISGFSILPCALCPSHPYTHPHLPAPNPSSSPSHPTAALERSHFTPPPGAQLSALRGPAGPVPPGAARCRYAAGWGQPGPPPRRLRQRPGQTRSTPGATPCTGPPVPAPQLALPACSWFPCPPALPVCGAPHAEGLEGPGIRPSPAPRGAAPRRQDNSSGSTCWVRVWQPSMPGGLGTGTGGDVAVPGAERLIHGAGEQSGGAL